MSIFEPIPRESRFDDVTQELDEDLTDDVPVPAGTGGSLDPRSIAIAGGVVAAIVVAGLVVSNLADPASRSRPLVAERVDPGAAAVEQVEAKKPVPTADASVSPSVEDTRDDQSDSDDAPAWKSPDDSGDRPDDKPGKGNGRGHR